MFLLKSLRLALRREEGGRWELDDEICGGRNGGGIGGMGRRL